MVWMVIVGVCPLRPMEGAGPAESTRVSTSRVPTSLKTSPLTRHDALNQRLEVSSSRLQRLSVSPMGDGSWSAPLELDGRPRTLVLRPHSIRSHDFQVLVQDRPFGPLLPAPVPPVRTYRGSLLEEPDSRVAGTLDENNHLTGAILTSRGTFAIQPVAELGLAEAVDEHVLFRAEDVQHAGQYICGADAQAPAAVTDESLVGSVAGTGLFVVDLAIDADVEFFQLNGSSVANTIHDMENVMNTVEFIYERDADITYEITTVVVRTVEPDPYSATSPNALLNQFVANWNAVPQSFIRRDTAHLFTGKNLDGSVIGIAFLGTICNQSNGRGLSESRFTSAFTSRVALTAHEIGHNWNAPHCDGDPNGCHIMCSGLGGCNGIVGTNLKFGPTEQNQIMAFRNTRACINGLSNPPPFPFFDDFTSFTIDAGRWSYVNGAVVTDLGEGEPSAPFSLNLDSGGAENFRDDEFRTNFLPSGSFVALTLSYHTQHRGVETGESLVVEYWNNNLAWVEINRVTSDGVDQVTFEAFQHLMPANGLHNELRIRFRVEGDEADDDWFVDDVGMSAECSDVADCDDGLFCNGTEECLSDECVSGLAPCPPNQFCSESSDQCLDQPPCDPPTVTASGGRFLKVTPPVGSTDAFALFVYPECDESQGRYLGGSELDQHSAVLVDDAVDAAFTNSQGWDGAVDVRGAMIVPGVTYAARTNCGNIVAEIWSSSTTAATPRFGDNVGVFENGQWLPPDDSVDITTDVTAILQAFRNASSAPSAVQVDQIGSGISGIGCVADGRADIIDVTIGLDAFRGRSFEEATPCSIPTCP